jgi:hypothetical protein
MRHYKLGWFASQTGTSETIGRPKDLACPVMHELLARAVLGKADGVPNFSVYVIGVK